MSGKTPTKADYVAALRDLPARVRKIQGEALTRRLGITEADLRKSKTITSTFGAWMKSEGGK